MLVTDMQGAATITDLTQLLADALHDVRGGEGGALPVDEIESASFLIYRAMTNRSRQYHDLSHLFLVAHNLPALAKLAAIYHDIVYFPVDGGFSPDVSERIGDVVVRQENRIVLTTAADEMMSDLATIFGFTAGQELKQEGGLSEFLSAVVAVRELSAFLSDHDLWAVAACIEATIPFRPAVENLTPDDLLGLRLRGLRRGGLVLTEEEIDGIQILAARIANADVQNFGKPDLSYFIENTWQILTESNADFHAAGAYSIQTYREALVGMETFLSQLDPGVIFRRHGNTPDRDAYQALMECCRKNLLGALDYLKAHIAALSVVEAVAALTGGDGPSCYLMGAADSGILQNLVLVERLPIVKHAEQPAFDDEVLGALKCKHAGVDRFDSMFSPLAAYCYELLGNRGIAELVDRAHEVHAGKRDWRWFLADVPREVLREVASAMTCCAVMRKERFVEFLKAL